MSWWRHLFRGPLPENGNQSAPLATLADLAQIEAATQAEVAVARAELIGRLDRLQEDIAQFDSSSRHADVVDRLDQLVAEVVKLGREQFRATTLLEGHDTLLEELAEAARVEQDRREDAMLQERRAREDLESRARLELVKELLPVADALDASVRTAQELLGVLRAAPPDARVLPRRSWLAWLRAPVVPLPADEPAGDTVVDHSVAFDAWLRGLLLIEGRLQALFEREGVRPIQALGTSFDPHQHLAVATSSETSAPDGTVIAEELRGYLAGDRVLRHAEVIVARADGGLRRSDPTMD